MRFRRSTAGQMHQSMNFERLQKHNKNKVKRKIVNKSPKPVKPDSNVPLIKSINKNRKKIHGAFTKKSTPVFMLHFTNSV